MSEIKSTTKQTKKKKAVNDKPISYTTVEEIEEKETLSDKLKNAGNEAEKLTSNTSFKVGQEETPIFTPFEVAPSQEENQVREVNSFDDLLGALSDIDQKFENITDADYYPENYIEDALKSNIPDSLNLEKMEVPEINEEDIRAEIEESEKSRTEMEKEILKKEAQAQEKLKKDQIEELKETSKKESDEIGQIYDEYKVSVESDAIKRGLARSSVALLSMENVEGERARELSRVAENLTKSINKVESEIIDLQGDLELSLSNLDLELAVNINEKLEKKIAQLTETREKAIKFNNEVNEMEAQYQLKRGNQNDEIKALEEELRTKYEGYAQADKANQKLDIAYDFFKNMDRAKALEIIVGSPELAKSLGSGYYDLYYYVMRK